MKKRSRLWIIPVVIVSVFILALLLTAIFWTETFNWKSTVSASTINSIRVLTFNPITYRYFDGFTNKSIAQKYSECMNIPTNVEGKITHYKMFSVGLFIYDYENGKIDWVSPEPLYKTVKLELLLLQVNL